jgi:hypothetical protein
MKPKSILDPGCAGERDRPGRYVRRLAERFLARRRMALPPFAHHCALLRTIANLSTPQKILCFSAVKSSSKIRGN